MTKKDFASGPAQSVATPDDEARKNTDGECTSGARANPSVRTRFTKGQSGNPSGRPKHSRNKSTIVEKILNETITVRDGGRSCKMSKFEVIVTRMVNDAAKGDSKAQAQVLTWIKMFNLVDKLPQADIPAPLTANDEALIQNYLSRVGNTTSALDDGQNTGALNAEVSQ